MQLALQFSVNLLAVFINVRSVYADAQRAGLYAGWELVFRLPTTAAD